MSISTGTSENGNAASVKASMDTGEQAPALDDRREPTPVDDFERRVRICREMGIRELHDGKVHILFEPRQRTQSVNDETAALILRAKADASVR